MIKRLGNIFSLVLVVIFALAIYLAFDLPVAARRVPLLFSTCGLVAALIQLLAGMKTGFLKVSVEAKEREGGLFPKRLKEATCKLFSIQEINFFSWLFFFYLLIYLLGFTLAIPLFLFSILLLKYREKFTLVFLMSLGFCSAYYLLFIRIMKVAVHEGLLFNILGIPYF